MRKDFVKKLKPNRKSQIAKRKGTLSKEEISSSLKWYFAGMASGIIISLLTYLYSLPEDKREVVSDSSEARPVPAKITTKQKVTQFEFYDILPEKKSKPNKTILNIKTEKRVEENRIYFLQAGAFKKKKEAESRRAALVLLDLVPQITLTQETSSSPYRLTVGPLESLTETKKVQRLIENEGIKTLLKTRLKQ